MNLKELRAKLNVSLTEMANILEISKGSYWKIENGDSILSIKNALKISEHFKISLDDIYGITKEEQEAGVTATITIPVTAIEDDLLTYFREIGENLGEATQIALVKLFENLADNSKEN
jgi:DNA-binding XRE family transcriptional regulator